MGTGLVTGAGVPVALGEGWPVALGVGVANGAGVPLGPGVMVGAGVPVAWGSGLPMGVELGAELGLALGLGFAAVFGDGPQLAKSPLASPNATIDSLFFMAVSFRTQIRSFFSIRVAFPKRKIIFLFCKMKVCGCQAAPDMLLSHSCL